MAAELEGKRIAFLVANEGVEQVELTEPWKAVEEAGGDARAHRARSGRGPGVQPPGQGATRSRWTRPRARPTPSDYDGARAAGRRREPGRAAHRAERGRVPAASSSQRASRSA